MQVIKTDATMEQDRTVKVKTIFAITINHIIGFTIEKLKKKTMNNKLPKFHGIQKYVEPPH